MNPTLTTDELLDQVLAILGGTDPWPRLHAERCDCERCGRMHRLFLDEVTR